MNMDLLKEKMLAFLTKSRVHLGRTGTKNRQEFIDTIMNMLDEPDLKSANNDEKIMVLKLKKSGKSLQKGKGVTSMTGSDSAMADEELGRSPFGTSRGPTNE